MAIQQGSFHGNVIDLKKVEKWLATATPANFAAVQVEVDRGFAKAERHLDTHIALFGPKRRAALEELIA